MTSEIKQNILVTGANGFVGKALVAELLELNHNVSVISRDKNFKFPGVKIFYGDLNEVDFCKKVVDGIDTVYYLAGYKKNIAHHIKTPNDFVVGNVSPLLSFLEAVKVSKIKKIIYLSSTNVGLYKEGEEDGYVVGKYINELILKSFSKQFGISIKIARSSGIYGPGDNFDKETANFIPSIINKVYSGEKEILVWGKGERKMQFIFIKDLILNLMGMLDSKEDFFVIGNKETLTVNQIVEMIIRISGKNVDIRNDLTKPDKVTQLFEFNNLIAPKFDLVKGLNETIEYYNKIYA